MNTEFEATFPINSKEEIRQKLTELGAKLIKKEYQQSRAVFQLPKGHEIENGWLRVRDESDKITLTLKVVQNNTVIENQKEMELKVDNFDVAVSFLETIGCLKKAYQETLREIWELNGVEIMIDEWPFLEPYIEIEGKTTKDVQDVAEKLGYAWEDAYFGSVDGLYAQKYKISEERINNQTPEILFKMKNPFTK